VGAKWLAARAHFGLSVVTATTHTYTSTCPLRRPMWAATGTRFGGAYAAARRPSVFPGACGR